MRAPRVLRFTGSLLALVLSLAIILGLWAIMSPTPGVAIIRALFGYGANAASRALEPHVPKDVIERLDIAYDPANPSVSLDVFLPPAGNQHAGPVVVWIHGGAWVYGSKLDVRNYLKVLAGRGIPAVAVGYTIAPGATYPTPVRQVNRALRYLQENGGSLGFDTSRVIIAGDSAGAQIAAQVANVVTSQDYAKEIGIEAGMPADRLVGAILFCGPYDLGMVNFDGPLGFFLRTVVWAYSGRKDFENDKAFARLSIVRDVTPAFPPTFISVGNADPLAPQSKAMAAALRGKGVAVEELYFPDNRQPPLNHEYQFTLDEAGKLALEKVVAFVKSRASAN